jgi:hypothetical protein
MPIAEIRERLDRLIEHQFITGWHHQDRRWYVNCSVLWGPYTKAQISAFIEGCNAMGAAP